MEFLEPTTDTALWHRVDSPLGELQLVGDGRALTRLEMSPRSIPAGGSHDPEAFGDVEAQLDAYFAGELTEFDVPLAPAGSGFQLAVWAALTRIPYGETASYGEIAERGWAPGCGARGRVDERAQPDRSDHPVSPGDRGGRDAGGVRRRPAAEASAAGAGGRARGAAAVASVIVTAAVTSRS